MQASCKASHISRREQLQSRAKCVKMCSRENRLYRIPKFFAHNRIFTFTNTGRREGARKCEWLVDWLYSFLSFIRWLWCKSNFHFNSLLILYVNKLLFIVTQCQIRSYAIDDSVMYGEFLRSRIRKMVNYRLSFYCWLQFVACMFVLHAWCASWENNYRQNIIDCVLQCHSMKTATSIKSWRLEANIMKLL